MMAQIGYPSVSALYGSRPIEPMGLASKNPVYGIMQLTAWALQGGGLMFMHCQVVCLQTLVVIVLTHAPVQVLRSLLAAQTILILLINIRVGWII